MADGSIPDIRSIGFAKGLGHKALGHLLYGKNQIQEALKIWEKAAALDPKDSQLKNWLEKAKREEAIEGEFVQLASTQFDIRFDGKADPEIGYTVLEPGRSASQFARNLLARNSPRS